MATFGGMRAARRLQALFVSGLFLLAGGAAAAAPQTVPPNVAIAWDAKKDSNPKTYVAGDLRITMASDKPEEGSNPAPTLTVLSSRFGRAVLTGENGFPDPAAQFSVVKLDPKADGPAVILTTYSGGAHCCTSILILDPMAGGWSKINGGEWNGGPALPPKDLDGDGTPDFLLDDENFLYAFACYACGYAPPKILDVIGGVWTDVSTAPRFAGVYEKDARRLKSGCAENGGQNGLCAAFVADEARLGRLDAAWAYMLAHYNKTDDWTLPTGCRVARGRRACPKDQVIVYKTYPEALRAFLIDTGYVAANDTAAAPH
jgi:hypothetical protein